MIALNESKSNDRPTHTAFAFRMLRAAERRHTGGDVVERVVDTKKLRHFVQRCLSGEVVEARAGGEGCYEADG